MNFDAITKYFTVAEVARLWNIPPDSLNLNRAVMCGVLKVCLWVRGAYVATDDEAISVEVNGWCYPESGVQIDAFEMFYSSVRYPDGDRQVTIQLPEPLPLSVLLQIGVVMPDDVEAAAEVIKPGQREGWQLKSAATKEINGWRRIGSAMLVDGYGYDVSDKARAAEIVEEIRRATAGKDGKPMHAQTVAKYVQQAMSDYPAPRAPGAETGEGLQLAPVRKKAAG